MVGLFHIVLQSFSSAIAWHLMLQLIVLLVSIFQNNHFEQDLTFWEVVQKELWSVSRQNRSIVIIDARICDAYSLVLQ